MARTNIVATIAVPFIALPRTAAACTLSRSFVGQIARLALLAPDIVEAILARTLNQGAGLDRLEKEVVTECEEQRTI
jgi:hypothetical protein